MNPKFAIPKLTGTGIVNERALWQRSKDLLKPNLLINFVDIF
jgi:hypothetical protein